MANVNASKMVATYTDDFGNTYQNLKFKFENLREANASTLINAYPDRPEQNYSCSSSTLFDPRKIVIGFTTGESIELPIPSLDLVPNYVLSATNLANVACVELKGESWSNVPPAKLGIQASAFNNTGITGADRPERQSYSFSYNLDGENNPFQITTSLQTEPAEIFNTQLECLGDVQEGTGFSSPVSDSVGLRPRKFVGTRKNLISGTISRQIIVPGNSTAQIKQCGADSATVFNSLGYRGQSIRDSLAFYGNALQQG